MMFLTYVFPLMTVAVTVTLWALLIALGTPRTHWRDTLNLSLGGTFLTLAAFIGSIALRAVGVIDRDLVDDRVLAMLAGAFALIGLPRTVAELRGVLANRRRQEDAL